jgi:mycoredoxin
MASHPVTVFWRPGCPYCSRLRSRLRRAGIDTAEVNIWEDPVGAEFVRSVAGGNETVPTVRVGEQAFVNPSPTRLIDAIREFDPGLAVPLTGDSHPDWLVVVQWTLIAVLIVLSFSAEALGNSGLSWGIDAVAVAAFLLIRSVRMRRGRSRIRV